MVSYEGIRRPVELLRALDGPAADRGRRKPHEREILSQYFYDLYSVFMKKMSAFVLSDAPTPTETVTLQAMLQEMLRVKNLIAKK